MGKEEKQIIFTQTEVSFLLDILARYQTIPDIRRIILIIMFIAKDTLKDELGEQN